MSENNEHEVSETSVDQELKADEAVTEEESIEEPHVALPYPERVPNAEKGADHAHAYVMIKVLGALIIFSLIVAKFTSPF